MNPTRTWAVLAKRQQIFFLEFNSCIITESALGDVYKNTCGREIDVSVIVTALMSTSRMVMSQRNTTKVEERI